MQDEEFLVSAFFPLILSGLIEKSLTLVLLTGSALAAITLYTLVDSLKADRVISFCRKSTSVHF